MKMKKHIIAVGMALVLMLSTALAYAEPGAETDQAGGTATQVDAVQGFATEEESLAQYTPEFLASNEEAALNYEDLMQSFTVTGSELNSVAVSKFSEDKIYPNYYGGSYINDDGALVIFIKGNTAQRLAATQTISTAVGTNNFIVVPAQYSYNELEDVMYTLNTFMEQEPSSRLDSDVAANFLTYCLSDSDNNVTVELVEFSDESIALFKDRVLDSPAINFVPSTGTLAKDATNLNPGEKLSLSTGTYGSMGYRAKRNGVNGIVTAGHLATTVGWELYIGSNAIGEVKATRYSGSVDAAFVKTYSGYTPSNTINGGSTTLSTTISEPGKGTVVNKVGARTGHSSGKILSTNATFTPSDTGVTFTNLTSVQADCNTGDSGGIVYSYIAATNTRLTLGIVKGITGATKFYYVKANKLNSALGTSRY